MTLHARSFDNKLLEFIDTAHNALHHCQGEFSSLRQEARSRLDQLGLPTRKQEVFQYIPLRRLYAQDFCQTLEEVITPEELNEHVFPECQESVIVFINGSFHPCLSRMGGISPKVSLLPLSEAMETFGGFLKNQWRNSLKDEADPFVVMNAALHPKGAFLYFPPKTVVEKPIQILHLVSSSAPTACLPRLHIFLGAQAEARLVATSSLASCGNHFINAVIEMHLEEDAHLKLQQNIPHGASNNWQFQAYRAALKRNSTLKTVTITEGDLCVRTDYKILLLGECAEAQLNGLCKLSAHREAHSHILIDHQAPNCRSMQLFKGVLDDHSRSSFEGKILVRQAAQKTDAFQLNNNLLLSKSAHADSKPNLEIFADDVKASHGATFGPLEEEHLFYMKARGFSEQEARNLLVSAYCQEIYAMLLSPLANSCGIIETKG